MTRDQWNSHYSNDKVIWDSFSPQTKATILGFKTPTSTPTSPTVKANLYDISADNYFCMLHIQSPIEETPNNNGNSLDTYEPELFDSSMEHDDSPVLPSIPESTSDNSNLLTYVTKVVIATW